jgi:hypothetical protein
MKNSLAFKNKSLNKSRMECLRTADGHLPECRQKGPETTSVSIPVYRRRSPLTPQADVSCLADQIQIRLQEDRRFSHGDTLKDRQQKNGSGKQIDPSRALSISRFVVPGSSVQSLPGKAGLLTRLVLVRRMEAAIRRGSPPEPSQSPFCVTMLSTRKSRPRFRCWSCVRL